MARPSRSSARRRPLVNHHVDIGENLRPWALLLFGFTLAVMLWDWWTKREAAKTEAGGSDRSVSGGEGGEFGEGG